MNKPYEPGLILLCQAIVCQTNKDYYRVCKHGDTSEVTKAGCELFYRGPLFNAMLGDYMDAEDYMALVREGKLHKQRKEYQRTNKVVA